MVNGVIRDVESAMKTGTDVLAMTSREPVTALARDGDGDGKSGMSSLEINARVGDALVDVLRGVRVRPRYIIAKVSISLHTYIHTFTHPQSGISFKKET